MNVPLQSAYRQHHSTETTLLKVHNDVLRALYKKECVLLVLLDLSAAFDTVDHSRLKALLEQIFGVSESALRWLESYMSERQQAVTIKGIGSEKRTLEYGVPQGSVLGPELFKDYVAPLSSLIQSFGVNFHGYADDTQIYVPFVPGQNEDSARDKIQECIAAVKSWMAQNWLKLNDDKTEFIIIGSPCNLKKVVTEYIVVGDHKIFKSKQVKNIVPSLTLLLQWKLRS